MSDGRNSGWKGQHSRIHKSISKTPQELPEELAKADAKGPKQCPDKRDAPPNQEHLQGQSINSSRCSGSAGWVGQPNLVEHVSAHGRGGWIRRPLKVPSNPGPSMILQFS